MPDSTFAFTRSENRNGVTSWRVSGWLAGVRIRKNFTSKEEAAAEKATLELKDLQATSGLRSVRTFLADDQLREAEAAYPRQRLIVCPDEVLRLRITSASNPANTSPAISGSSGSDRARKRLANRASALRRLVFATYALSRGNGKGAPGLVDESSSGAALIHRRGS